VRTGVRIPVEDGDLLMSKHIHTGSGVRQPVLRWVLGFLLGDKEAELMITTSSP
jgi:hypothetical protein